MGKGVKKAGIVLLVILGGLLGYWLSRQNQRLFEQAFRARQGQAVRQTAFGDASEVRLGMEIWQVKEILGPPDRRVLVSGDPRETRETWIYGGCRLHFKDGLLIWQEKRPEQAPAD